MSADMKKLLKIFEGAENTKVLTEAATMNISVTGDTPQEIADVMRKMFSASDSPITSPTANDVPSMAHTITKLDSFNTPKVVADDYKNEPEPQYKDVDYITKDVAGGLNGPKKMHKHSYRQGDNPMAMESSLDSLTERLFKELEKAKQAGLVENSVLNFFTKKNRTI
jgi:hypothetical protein